jgi:hypothetical protein
MEHSSVDEFSQAKPQRWVVDSFEYHRGSRGVPGPARRNICDFQPNDRVIRLGVGPRPTGAVTGPYRRRLR